MTVKPDREKKLHGLLSEHPGMAWLYLNNPTVHSWFKQYINGRCTMDEAFVGSLVRMDELNTDMMKKLTDDIRDGGIVK